MSFWKSLVGKLWLTITALVACVLLILGIFLLPYVDVNFNNSIAVKKLFTLVSIIGFSLTTFFALFLLTKITQPMQQLIKATDSIRKGNYETRLSIRTSDEIGELTSAFNHMAAELENTIRSLNYEKEQLASVLRSMNDAVISMDITGEVVLMNPPGESLLQAWRYLDETKTRSDWNESNPNYDVPQPLVPLFEKVLQGQGDQITNIHVRHGVWSVHMAPLSSNGQLRGAVALIRDVKEEVRLEKMRRDFVANVSHEIRTPLSMMQGYSEALLDGMATSHEERQELVQVIHDESLRMGRLVHELLDIARMEAGHTDFVMRPVNVSEIVERVYRKFQVRAKEQNMKLTLDLQSEPLVMKEASEDRLEQVLTNLLDNAFRHTPDEHGISITAGLEDDRNKQRIHIRIQDEGEGIPAEDLPFIFERFYKADKARVRSNSVSTGLGLAIVKNIVESHHGSILAESNVGEGTIFHLFLPVE